MIKFNNVSVHYGCGEAETIALNNVSFEITKGEFVTIIGKSGSGKTTLLNVLGGITNICIPLKYRRNKKIPQKSYIYEVMDKLGILDYEYNFPYELSGGE